VAIREIPKLFASESMNFLVFEKHEKIWLVDIDRGSINIRDIQTADTPFDAELNRLSIEPIRSVVSLIVSGPFQKWRQIQNTTLYSKQPHCNKKLRIKKISLLSCRGHMDHHG
jgi:hypothetical protein